MDHLRRLISGDAIWRRPTGEDDIQDVYEEQVVPIKVEGEWDFTTDIPRYIISNHEEIQRTFEQINENISRLSLIVKCIFQSLFFILKSHS